MIVPCLVPSLRRLAVGQADHVDGDGPSLVRLPDQMLEALRDAVPFDTFCWGALDPGSLLPMRAIGTTIPASSPMLWKVHELLVAGTEANTYRFLARPGRRVSLLGDTGTARKTDSPI